MRQDTLDSPIISLQARQLLGLICRKGGADCPLLLPEDAKRISAQLRSDPTVTLQLLSSAEGLSHYTEFGEKGCSTEATCSAHDRKRDLDVLQRLGLVPGDTRRARYLIELLFERIPTPDGICAFATEKWQGCPLARSGAYESVKKEGWQAVVYARSEEEMALYRKRNVEAIETSPRLYIRPHHLMCFCCWFAGGEGQGLRPNDTLSEIFQRIRQEPDVPVVLVEGSCMACECCDGFHPETGRCVHPGGLIRDFKKDLDCFQRLGLLPGAVLPAQELLSLLFERIPSTRLICAYGDGIVRSQEWAICSSPEGNPGYEKTRAVFLRDGKI